MLCYGLFGYKFVLTCGSIILILNLIIIIAIKKKLPNPWVQPGKLGLKNHSTRPMHTPKLKYQKIIDLIWSKMEKWSPTLVWREDTNSPIVWWGHPIGLSLQTPIYKLDFGQITTYPPVVWLKFKLPTCGLKFDTLSTWS